MSIGKPLPSGEGPIEQPLTEFTPGRLTRKRLRRSLVWAAMALAVAVMGDFPVPFEWNATTVFAAFFALQAIFGWATTSPPIRCRTCEAGGWKEDLAGEPPACPVCGGNAFLVRARRHLLFGSWRWYPVGSDMVRGGTFLEIADDGSRVDSTAS